MFNIEILTIYTKETFTNKLFDVTTKHFTTSSWNLKITKNESICISLQRTDFICAKDGRKKDVFCTERSIQIIINFLWIFLVLKF